MHGSWDQLDLLIVAPLEQARIGRVGDTERHFGG